MRKRIILISVVPVVALLVLIALAAPFERLAIAQDQASVTGVVETGGDRLNMRFGPGVDYDLVLKLEPGTIVTVLDATADGAWLQVQPEEGDVSGWVSADFVALDGELPTAGSDAAEGLSAQDLLIPTATPIALATVTPTPDLVELDIEPTAEMKSVVTVEASAEATTTATSELEVVTPTAATTVTVAPTQELVTPTAEATAVVAPTHELVAPTEEAATASDESPSSVGQLFPRTFARAQGLPSPTAIAPSADEESPALEPTRVGEAGAVEDDATVDKVATEKPTPTPIAPPADEQADEQTDSDTQSAASSIPAGSPVAITQPASMNVRTGPGTNYGVALAASAGSEFEIIGRSPGHTWLQVISPDQDEPVWLYAELVEVVGSLDDIPTLTENELPEAPLSAEPAVTTASSASIANAPAPTGGGNFGYGVQAHLLGGQAGAALNAVNDMGFNWVKQQVEWYRYESSPGARGFGELAGIVNAAGNRNINVLFSVVNAPEWAREDGFDSSVGGPPADPQTYANFVGAMAGQFCGTSLKAIEIWNEQNLHYEWGNKPLNGADYMNLLRPAYASIKAACPEMLVISGALTPAADAGTLARDDFAYLEEMYKNGLASYSDGIGAHPSGYNVPADVRWESACATIQQTGNIFNGACDTPHHSWSFLSTMEGYRNIMNVYGDGNKLIWPTEFGWAAGGALNPHYMYAEDNSFDEQAAWTVQAFQTMRNWGWVGPAFLWNLNFRVVADGTEKAQWGIVRNDYTPLPVYDALKAMPK